jgi:hypothetical protein
MAVIATLHQAVGRARPVHETSCNNSGSQDPVAVTYESCRVENQAPSTEPPRRVEKSTQRRILGAAYTTPIALVVSATTDWPCRICTHTKHRTQLRADMSPAGPSTHPVDPVNLSPIPPLLDSYSFHSSLNDSLDKTEAWIMGIDEAGRGREWFCASHH